MSTIDPRKVPIGPVTRPHAVLDTYYADEDERQRYVRRVFDETAVDYDRIERVLGLGMGPAYRRRALLRAGLKPGDRVLDVAVGTGLVAREAMAVIGPAGQLTGVDPSAGMMAQADLPGATLVEGKAESLPCGDGQFDFVSMGYALRHLDDVSQAFNEFYRVLEPGGTALVIEIVKPASPVGTMLLKGYMRHVVPLIARVVSRQGGTPDLWRYYWDTIEACVPPQRVLDTLLAAGFDAVRRDGELGIFVEYVARKPL